MIFILFSRGRYTSYVPRQPHIPHKLGTLVETLARNISISTVDQLGGHKSTTYGHLENLLLNVYGVCFKIEITASPRRGNLPIPVEVSLPSFQKIMPKSIAQYYSYALVFFGEETMDFNPTMPSYVTDGKLNFLEITDLECLYKNSRKEPCISEQPHKVSQKVNRCFNNCTASNISCTFMDSLKTTEPQDNFCNWSTLPSYEVLFYCYESCVESNIGYHDIPCRQVKRSVTTHAVPHPENTTKIQIKYRFATSLFIEEKERYTWSVFFSNFGGISSLLCGASVISVAQILVYGVKQLLGMARNKSRDLRGSQDLMMIQRNCTLDTVIDLDGENMDSFVNGRKSLSFVIGRTWGNFQTKKHLLGIRYIYISLCFVHIMFVCVLFLLSLCQWCLCRVMRKKNNSSRNYQLATLSIYSANCFCCESHPHTVH